MKKKVSRSDVIAEDQVRKNSIRRVTGFQLARLAQKKGIPYIVFNRRLYTVPSNPVEPREHGWYTDMTPYYDIVT